MKGILLKDFLIIKKQLPLLIFFFLLYCGLSFTLQDSSMISGIIMIFCTMLPINAVSFDDRSGFPKYALTMPVSRSALVISKYLMGLILLGGGSLLSFATNLFLGQISLFENLWSTAIPIVMGCLLLSLALPPIFKFGVEKGKLVLLCTMLPAGFIGGYLAMSLSKNHSILIGKNGNLLQIQMSAFDNSPWAVLLLLFLGAFMLLLSMLLSLRIYRNKDF